MKIVGLYIFLIFAFFGCRDNEYQEVFKLSYQDTSIIRFHVTNCVNAVNLTFFYNTFFPIEQPKHDIYFTKDSVYSYKIQINHPVTVILLDNTRTNYVGFFCLPNDTLDIYYNASNEQKFSESVKYVGKTSAISNYLTQGKLMVSPYPKMEEGVDLYCEKIDSITGKRRQALIEYNERESLPDWYIKFEKLSIEYAGAMDKLNQFSQRLAFYDQYVPKPLDFIENLKVNIDNPDAEFCEDYLAVLSMIRPLKYDTLLQQNVVDEDIVFNYIYDNIYAVKDYLNGNMSYFTASRISYLLNPVLVINKNDRLKYLDRVDSLIDEIEPFIEDTIIYNNLLDYRNKQLMFTGGNIGLSKGQLAPDFYLNGIDANKVRLSDFEGQFVLVNFWATWCAPCIESIDEKNKLIDDYGTKGLILFNVCLDSNDERWKEIIHDYHFQGTHVMCDGNWQTVLSENYGIYSIPHYALIDRDKKIIFNGVANFTQLEGMLTHEIQ